ncbi:MAG TPA: response regulator transcription factor [Myxococcota bacterium]|nr:response regulator transcription factor [Myxococcota bacterium]
MRVVLADDDAGMCEALRSLLAEHLDIKVVGDAADGQAAIERARELEPAIVVMDVVMPGMGGIEATRRVREALPRVRVIGLSLHEDRHFVAAMRAAGASGFVRKDRIHEELAQALRAVAAGGTWWSTGAESPG